MFDNIGGKIKMLAKVVCWIGIIVSAVIAIIMFANAVKYSNDIYTLLRLAYIILGTLLSWIGSFFTYGFGELIEKTAEIASNTKNTAIIPNYYPDKKLSGSDILINNQKSVYRRCENCGNMISSEPCSVCGYQVSDDKKEMLDELLNSNLISKEEYDKKING